MTAKQPFQLFIKHDFLNQAEIQLFCDYFKSACPWEMPKNADFTERKHIGADTLSLTRGDSDYLSKLNNTFMDFAKRARFDFEDFFGETLVQPNVFAMRKWVVGDSQAPHCDVGHPEGKLIFSENRPEAGPLSIHMYDVASVLYFNDDFEGGDIYLS